MFGNQVSEGNLKHRLANFDLLDAPGHLLRRNHQRSYEIFTRHVGDDVTRQQIGLLIVLAKRSGVSQRELVDATGFDKSTLKEMIGRMVAKGWIKRARDPKDSRAWTMDITPQGEALVAERIDAVEAAQREIIAPLTADQQVFLIDALRKLLGLERSGDQ